MVICVPPVSTQTVCKNRTLGTCQPTDYTCCSHSPDSRASTPLKIDSRSKDTGNNNFVLGTEHGCYKIK